MLLLMSVIGLAAVRGTNLQELMAGNARDKQIAFQAAETALRSAEDIVGGPNPPAVGVAVGVIDQVDKGATSLFWRDEFIWSKDGAAATSVAVLDALKFTQAEPRYVVEKLQVAYVPGSDGRGADWLAGLQTPEISVYRITAKGVGITESSIVYLQSMYRR